MLRTRNDTDNSKVKVSHFDESINDMVEVTVYWRDNALNYAKGKKWVTIRVCN